LLTSPTLRLEEVSKRTDYRDYGGNSQEEVGGRYK